MTGLPLHTWPRERAAVAFLGIGAHVGAARSQNAHGHVLGHVRDLGVASKGNSSVRIYQTSGTASLSRSRALALSSRSLFLCLPSTHTHLRAADLPLRLGRLRGSGVPAGRG